MDNYVSNLMMNHSLETESISSLTEIPEYKKTFEKISSKRKSSKKNKSHQKGGKEEQQLEVIVMDNIAEEIPHIPHGGFPPIYLCETIKKEETDKKEREYSTHKNAISIKDIMKKRKEINFAL
jgi:hypothetical protein